MSRGTETTSVLQRSVSVTGATFMVVGLLLVTLEMQTQLMLGRLGQGGRIVLLFCGTMFSIWGLKEIIADWWPWLGNRGLVRNRFHLPVEGRIYLLIMLVTFIGSLIGRSNPLLLVFSMMAGPFVMNGWLTFTMLRSIQVRRLAPERVMLGEPFSVEINFENHKSWLSSWLMVVKDQVQSKRERLHPAVLFIRVPGNSEQRGHYQLQLMERGVYGMGPFEVDTRFPLGLVQRGINIASRGKINVYPKLGKLTADWRKKLLQANEIVQNTASQGGPMHEEFHRIREFRTGDDLRSIHWRSTARRNELMVREYRESRDRSLVVLVDLATGSETNVELALSFAATVCVEHMKQSRESKLTCAILGDRLSIWNGGAGRGRIEELLDLFAEVQPVKAGSADALWQVARNERATLPRVLVITTRADDIRRELQKRGSEELGATSGALQVIGARPEELRPLFE